MQTHHNPGSIIALVAQIREQANAFIVDELARRGVTDLLPAHGAVLRVLFKESPVPMGALAEAIGRKKNTVTSLINTLEERGYCRRQADSRDARVQLVALTEKGESVRDIQAEISVELLRKIWQGVSEREQELCIEVLRAVRGNLASSAG